MTEENIVDFEATNQSIIAQLIEGFLMACRAKFWFIVKKGDMP